MENEDNGNFDNDKEPQGSEPKRQTVLELPLLPGTTISGSSGGCRSPRLGVSKSECTINTYILENVGVVVTSTSFSKQNNKLINEFSTKPRKFGITLENFDENAASTSYKPPATDVESGKIEKPKESVKNLRCSSSVVPPEAFPVNSSDETCYKKNENPDLPSRVTETVSDIPPLEERKETRKLGSIRSNFTHLTDDSLSSIGSNVCRICMTRGKERLISPCNCKGSLASVHLTCLERWLNQAGRTHCELCGFCYPSVRTPRYTIIQALRLWFGNPRNRTHLQSDCLIFWLLSTVTAGLLAVCVVGTQYFVIEGKKMGKGDGYSRRDNGISHRVTEAAMDFFMVVVLCGYCVTVYLLWKDHYLMWNRWRRANQNVRLLLAPDVAPVPFIPRIPFNV